VLRAFIADYPETKAYCIYWGERHMSQAGIDIIPLVHTLKKLPEIL